MGGDEGHYRRTLERATSCPDHVCAARIEFNSGLGNAGHVLYGLVRCMRPDVCVEIGSARGKSACYIGMALKENRRGLLYAIDPHRSTAWNDDIHTVEAFRTRAALCHAASVNSLVRAYIDCRSPRINQMIQQVVFRLERPPSFQPSEIDLMSYPWTAYSTS